MKSKSMTVKLENGVLACYSSGHKTGRNEDGTSYTIEETDEEMWQSCYNSLINTVKRNEFEKNLIFLLQNHFNNIDSWTNIHVKLSFSTSMQAELNVSNTNNTPWGKMELPEIKEQ